MSQSIPTLIGATSTGTYRPLPAGRTSFSNEILKAVRYTPPTQALASTIAAPATPTPPDAALAASEAQLAARAAAVRARRRAMAGGAGYVTLAAGPASGTVGGSAAPRTLVGG